MTETLMTIAALQVNASAIPREVYFQTRNVNRKQFGQSDNWVKVIEMGIEGDGNDAILSIWTERKTCSSSLGSERRIFRTRL